MNVRQRILSLRLMDKSKNRKNFMNEIGVTASVKHIGADGEANASRNPDRRIKR